MVAERHDQTSTGPDAPRQLTQSRIRRFQIINQTDQQNRVRASDEFFQETQVARIKLAVRQLHGLRQFHHLLRDVHADIAQAVLRSRRTKHRRPHAVIQHGAAARRRQHQPGDDVLAPAEAQRTDVANRRLRARSVVGSDLVEELLRREVWTRLLVTHILCSFKAACALRATHDSLPTSATPVFQHRRHFASALRRGSTRAATAPADGCPASNRNDWRVAVRWRGGTR